MANNSIKIDIRGLQESRTSKTRPTQSFNINSYRWSHELLNPYGSDINTNGDSSPTAEQERQNVQKIILQEFQPNAIFDTKAIMDSWQIPGVNQVIGVGAATIGQAAKITMFENLRSKYALGTRDKNGKHPALGLPLDFINNYFDGSFLNTFELPFVNNTYLDADTTENWSTAGGARYFGDKLGEAMKNYVNIDFPTTPIWNLGNYKGEDLKFEFFLINDTIEWLVKNFTMLNALASGAYWIQMDMMQQSPNVYKIIVPGRFIYIFAAMGIKVSTIGKLRKVSVKDMQNLQSAKGIQGDPDALFPDAYKIEINIKNLAPNNFNTYMNYLINGREGNVSVGQRTGFAETTYELAKSSVKNIFGGITENVKGGWDANPPGTTLPKK